MATLNDHTLVLKTNYCLMQVESIAEGEHSAILSTFIKLPFVIKIIVLSIFEWPFYTGFTVCAFKEGFWGHMLNTVKPVLSGHLKEDPKICFQDQ